jgi:hypothetical protein
MISRFAKSIVLVLPTERQWAWLSPDVGPKTSPRFLSQLIAFYGTILTAIPEEKESVRTKIQQTIEQLVHIMMNMKSSMIVNHSLEEMREGAKKFILPRSSLFRPSAFMLRRGTIHTFRRESIISIQNVSHPAISPTSPLTADSLLPSLVPSKSSLGGVSTSSPEATNRLSSQAANGEFKSNSQQAWSTDFEEDDEDWSVPTSHPLTAHSNISMSSLIDTAPSHAPTSPVSGTKSSAERIAKLKALRKRQEMKKLRRQSKDKEESGENGEDTKAADDTADSSPMSSSESVFVDAQSG